MEVVDRARRIILAPGKEWHAIDREPSNASFLLTHYVAILAAIPAVCGFIGWILIGLPIVTALVISAARYLMTFVMVYVLAFIVDGLAQTFGGRRDFDSAFKLVVYAATPVWLAGVFLLIPRLDFLQTVLGLYAIYLLWTGIPPLMRSPDDRALIYTVVVILCLLVVTIVVGVLLSLVIGFRAFM